MRRFVARCLIAAGRWLIRVGERIWYHPSAFRGNALDAYGRFLSVERRPNETDTEYRERLKFVLRRWN